MTYSDKLRDPRWQKKRLEILNRDEFTCLLCGDTETTLHVHHLKYERGKNPWEYEDDNFQTLCEDCHFIVEESKNDRGIVITKIRKSKLENSEKIFIVIKRWPDGVIAAYIMRMNSSDKSIIYETNSFPKESFVSVIDLIDEEEERIKDLQNDLSNKIIAGSRMLDMPD